MHILQLYVHTYINYVSLSTYIYMCVYTHIYTLIHKYIHM